MSFREARFAHPWRDYQARILAEFERHAADGHFHVVAAPGSGKTILGLEVIRRLDRPTLVCAPTLALRAQWVERLVGGFLGGHRPGWISEDLAAPGWLTFTTYQALHASTRRESPAALGQRLHAAGVRALVLDEAHHLRQEWWRALDAVHRALADGFVVALTATPPYDAAQAEWNRYLRLAGPIDAEIGAPELVRSGDLCPHQDYVYVQEPTPRERARVEAFEREVCSLLADLALDRGLVEAVLASPLVAAAADRLDAVLERPGYALSLAVFLRHADGVAPAALLEALGVEAAALPPFDAAWAESLLEGLLFHDPEALAAGTATVEALRARLQAMGALERRRVRLLGSPALDRRLRQSPTKLRAVADIVEAESRALGDGLRLLVLTERIHDAPVAEQPGRAAAARVGVLPIFERLRGLRLTHVRLGVATGRLGIVPAELGPDFEADLAATPGSPRGEPLAHDPGHLRFALSGDAAAGFVRLATRALEEGRLTVLVGTTALLGEGWDAPCVNTVVLATTIGAYVTTNQSRGRALRRHSPHPEKTANIWHPVCLELGAEHEGSELRMLRERFSGFVGPALARPVLESGLARLGLPERLDGTAALAWNAAMFRHADDRAGMASLWRQALQPAAQRDARPLRETRLPPRSLPRTVVRWLPAAWGLAARFERWRTRREIAALALAAAEALHEAGSLESAPAAGSVQVDMANDRIGITIDGLSVRDEVVLHEALRQLFCPLFAPRYLLRTKRHTWVAPKELGSRRERAEILLRRVRRRLGRAELLATARPEGRRLLLAAVGRYLAAHLHQRPQTGLRWS